MTEWLSKLIDQASEFFAHRKGLLPLTGIVLIILNFIFRLAFPGWLASSDLLLHLGIIVAVFGLMLGRVL